MASPFVLGWIGAWWWRHREARRLEYLNQRSIVSWQLADIHNRERMAQEEIEQIQRDTLQAMSDVARREIEHH